MGLLALIGLLGCAQPPASPAAEGAELSLWALGDTGKSPPPRPLLGGGLVVARAMERLDRLAPADAVVLLGDNFYPDGLMDHELYERLRGNVARPYCRFLRFTPEGQALLGAACRSEPSPRMDVQMLAVLGNHDYHAPESPKLQIERVPRYVENWRIPEGLLEVVELPGGVSLILLDSNLLTRQATDHRELREALSAARGPWRVIAAHHPAIDPGYNYVPFYAALVASEIEAAGVPVHLFLAGHEHNLQILEGDPPRPALQVISGGGSTVRPVSPTQARRHFARASLGFARVDAFAGSDPRLEVTLYAVSTPRLFGVLGGGRAQKVARFALLPDGSAKALPLAAKPVSDANEPAGP